MDTERGGTSNCPSHGEGGLLLGIRQLLVLLILLPMLHLFLRTLVMLLLPQDLLVMICNHLLLTVICGLFFARCDLPTTYCNSSTQNLDHSSREVVKEGSELLLWLGVVQLPLAKRHFTVEGGGGADFEALWGRNSDPPPFIHHNTPPRRASSGVGAWECSKFGPVRVHRTPSMVHTCGGMAVMQNS